MSRIQNQQQQQHHNGVRDRKYHVSVNSSMTPEQVEFIDRVKPPEFSTSEWMRQTIRHRYPDFPF